MSFALHPSEDLQALFRDRPFQGQVPEQAKIIFLTSDTNYAEDIAAHSFFAKILEYHADGVGFWQKYGVHHPILLPDYPFKRNHGGVPFHRRFTTMGLDPSYADKVCFIELLHTPTIGRMSTDKTAYLKLLDVDHVSYIDQLILSNRGQLFLMSKNILDSMRYLNKKYEVFKWIKQSKWNIDDEIKLGRNHLKMIYHFSSSTPNTYRAHLKVVIDEFLAQSAKDKNLNSL